MGPLDYAYVVLRPGGLISIQSDAHTLVVCVCVCDVS